MQTYDYTEHLQGMDEEQEEMLNKHREQLIREGELKEEGGQEEVEEEQQEEQQEEEEALVL